MEIKIKEARSKFSALINQVEEGADIILTGWGKEVTRRVSAPQKVKRLPSLREFRKSIKVSGKPLSATVIEDREE
jgi:antitoxin (DNA-binding transcriptional repressor) of toxin-antitoxin stability system